MLHGAALFALFWCLPFADACGFFSAGDGEVGLVVDAAGGAAC
jgi:hypothetical protein